MGLQNTWDVEHHSRSYALALVSIDVDFLNSIVAAVVVVAVDDV